MDQTEDGLKAFLRGEAQKAWQSGEQPYWLSMLAPDLKPLGIDYKSILGEERLKAFVKRTEGETTYRVVEHPRIKAKVGLVPWEQTFVFTIEAAAESGRENSRSDVVYGREKVVLAFLKSLAKLSDDELDSVVLPTRVLVKLLDRK